MECQATFGVFSVSTILVTKASKPPLFSKTWLSGSLLKLSPYSFPVIYTSLELASMYTVSSKSGEPNVLSHFSLIIDLIRNFGVLHYLNIRVIHLRFRGHDIKTSNQFIKIIITRVVIIIIKVHTPLRRDSNRFHRCPLTISISSSLLPNRSYTRRNPCASLPVTLSPTRNKVPLHRAIF